MTKADDHAVYTSSSEPTEAEVDAWLAGAVGQLTEAI